MIESDLEAFASKKFGQNFLKDKSVLQKIIEAMPDDDLPVVEIGPGLGDLTKSLLDAKKRVVAYEVDKRLCVHLATSFETAIEQGQLLLKCGDVLEYWQEGSLLDEPCRLVANLPYYIATRIVLKLLKDEQCQSALVMVQKEVAQKFAAVPGEKAFGSLSVLTSSCANATLCFEVPPSSFVPEPKVDSAVLEVVKFKSLDDASFEHFLKTAFSSPRKRLIKNLSSSIDKKWLEALFDELGIDRNIRPHQVDTTTFWHLYNKKKVNEHGREAKERSHEIE